MHIVLTGATGFIGCRVAPLLVAEGNEVTAIVRPESDRSLIAGVSGLRLFELDLDAIATAADRVRALRPEMCLHLAWTGWFGPHSRQEGNLPSLRMSVDLLRVMAEAGCQRFVGVGSCVEYDLDATVLNEETPLRPRNLYAAGKAAFYLFAEQWCRWAGMSFAWPRVFHVYGPADEPTRLVPSLVRALVRNELARTTLGEQERDLLHVDDVASAIWTIARGDREGAVNVGSGIPVRVADVAREIARLAGRPDLIEIGALPYRKDEPMRIVADVGVLRSMGWAPRISLEDGLRRTIEWWRANDMRSRALQ